MVKPYFPDFFGNQFTRTPNLFFDEILCKGTLAEIKVIGCLIRRTLGFNNESGWTGLSRSKIAKLMNMSERSVTTGAQGAEKKGWILTYDDPRKGKGHQPRYYFLNNSTNQLIVYGLERKKFFVEDLEDLTLSGIKKLLIKSKLMDENGTPLVQLQLGKDFHENGCSREKNSPVSGEKNSLVSGEKNSPVDKGQSQEQQGVSQSLNTTTEIHSFKYNLVVVVDKVIEKWNSLLVEKGEEPMTPELARDLLKDAAFNEDWVIKCIENVAKDYENVDEAIAAVRFAIKHYGWKPRQKKNKKGKSPSNKKETSDLSKSMQQKEGEGNKNLDGRPDPQAQEEIREALRRMRERSQKPTPQKIKQRIEQLEKLKREEEGKALPNQTVISGYIRSIEDLKKQLRALQERESEESEVRV